MVTAGAWSSQVPVLLGASCIPKLRPTSLKPLPAKAPSPRYGGDCMVVCNDWHSALVPMLIHAEKPTGPGSFVAASRCARSRKPRARKALKKPKP